MLETGRFALTTPGTRSRASPESSVILTEELIEEFLESLREMGRIQETISAYQHKLRLLFVWLPEDKCICRGTLDAWRKALLAQGYAPRTVNVCISAANSLLEYCGRRELQIGQPLTAKSAIQPELTRTEYLRLLSTARTLGKEREYLLIKVFGTTGLTPHDLPLLTAEAAELGKITVSGAVLHIPDCLQLELLDYAGRQGISSGPLFVTKSGRQLRRTNITKLIQSLCRDARVAEEKVTPRCLKKLYQATQAGIQANISLLVEQAHDRLLETEQLAVGWKQEEPVGRARPAKVRTGRYTGIP